MKALLIFVAVLFTAHTSFAELRYMLVEVIASNATHERCSPTVNIYSDIQSERRTGASIAAAAAVLEHAENPADSVHICVLSSDWAFGTSDLLDLLEGLRRNSAAQISWVEVVTPSHFAERSKQLHARFRFANQNETTSP